MEKQLKFYSKVGYMRATIIRFRAPAPARGTVKTRATKEQFRHSNSYLIFELIPEFSFVTKSDLDYAYDACHEIQEAQVRHECYAAFGIEGLMMDKYYLKISNLERSYYQLAAVHPQEMEKGDIREE